jgi:membrane-associated phospholipid phosphatase
MRSGAGAFLAVLSCPVAVVFCVAVVDRPMALLAHADLAGHRRLFDAMTHVVDPIPPLAACGLAVAGFAALLGWRPGAAARTLIACCVATLIAIVLKDELKFAFGRLWPETWVEANPSLIGDGAYGFFPFHGGRGWSSFPSGHTTLVTAPVAVLWARLPRWRPILALPVVVAVAGLFGADYHFVGDMVAGLYLGAACGAGALALVREPVGTGFAPPP